MADRRPRDSLRVQRLILKKGRESVSESTQPRQREREACRLKHWLLTMRVYSERKAGNAFMRRESPAKLGNAFYEVLNSKSDQ